MANNIIHTFYKSTDPTSTIELKDVSIGNAERMADSAGRIKGIKYKYSHSNRASNGRVLSDTKLFNGQSVNDMT